MFIDNLFADRAENLHEKTNMLLLFHNAVESYEMEHSFLFFFFFFFCKSDVFSLTRCAWYCQHSRGESDFYVLISILLDEWFAYLIVIENLKEFMHVWIARDAFLKKWGVFFSLVNYWYIIHKIVWNYHFIYHFIILFTTSLISFVVVCIYLLTATVSFCGSFLHNIFA